MADKISMSDIVNFSKRHLTILLILIPIFFAIFFRVSSVYLPATDQWANDAIQNNIRAQVIPQVMTQYPNLPQYQLEELINERVAEILTNEKDAIEQQAKLVSGQFKQQMKDDSGQTYLLAIDPWTYYRNVNNIIEYGHIGNEMRDGVTWDTYSRAPLGSAAGSGSLHVYLIYYIYKIINVVKPVSVMTIMFYIPVMLIALAVIPAFFIARRKGGNIAGVIAGIIVAISAPLLSRTPAGFSDTDGYSVFFPLFIVWFYLAAFDAPNNKLRALYSAIAGMFVGLFAFAWQGWWFITDFLLGITVVYMAYIGYMMYKYHNKHKAIHLKEKNLLVNAIMILVIFLGTITISTTLVPDSGGIKFLFQGPMGFLMIKSVGVSSVWPNVITTVAEQNASSVQLVVWQMGGSFLFVIALTGILLMYFRKDINGYFDVKYTTLLAVWFLAGVYAAVIGTRFSLLLVPAFAIALGIGVSMILEYSLKFISKEFNLNEGWVVKLGMLLIVLVLIFPRNLFAEAQSMGAGQMPNVNDGIYGTLEKIKYGTSEDAIITSWWDFGHWFKSIADRRVTFDGGTQNTPMAHYVGKMLSTPNQKEALGLLRMLDCGSDKGQKTLEKYMDVDTLHSLEVINEIIKLNYTDAYPILLEHNLSREEAYEVLNLTHCEPPEALVITSEDMVGKAGVWSHFGIWDFQKATMLNKVRSMKQPEAVKYITTRFNYTDTEASALYYQILSMGTGQAANNWIAPWPSYVSDISQCSRVGDVMTCDDGFVLNGTEAYFNIEGQILKPRRVSYLDGNSTVTKEYNGDVFAPQGRILGATVLSGDRVIYSDYQLTGSIFTRLFFDDGKGFECFDKFDDIRTFNGQRWITWRANWECLK